MAPWVTRLSKMLHWSPGDPRALETWSPRLRFIDVLPIISEYADIPSRGQRTLHRMMNDFPAVRNTLRLVRYDVLDDAQVDKGSIRRGQHEESDQS